MEMTDAELLAKAIDALIRVGNFVATLQAKARRLLAEGYAAWMDESLRQFVRERAGHRSEYC
jgi:hypothetical protein